MKAASLISWYFNWDLKEVRMSESWQYLGKLNCSRDSNCCKCSWVAWWLILCVNLSGLTNAQIVGKTLFLGVSVRVFLEEISIWINRLSKDVCPHQCQWASANLLRAWIGKKDRGKGKFVLFAWGWVPIFAWPWTSVFLVIRLSDSERDLHHWLPFSGLWTQTELHHWLSCSSSADSRSWDFMTSIITWANYCNKSLLYICIYPIGSIIWRILTNTGGKQFDILGK